jgi:hypothetical protein
VHRDHGGGRGLGPETMVVSSVVSVLSVPLC